MANTIISFYRAHVEHINTMLVAHNMFCMVYHGGVSVLSDAVTVTAHMTAAHLCQNICYTPVGHWAHYP